MNHVDALRGTGGLSCTTGARQMPKNARQSLCRAFLVGAHGKEHTVAICTVNSHCRAPCITTHSELSLPCVTGRRPAKKATHGVGRKRRGRTFVVHRTKNAWQRSYLCRAPQLKRTAKKLPLSCTGPRNHGKGTVPDDGNSAFVVRLHLDARQTFSKKIKKPKPLPSRPRLECLHTNQCIYR
jgi:hypothetical protein